MKRRWFISILFLVLISAPVIPSAFAQKTNLCADCHQKGNPVLVKQYLEGAMGKAEIECTQCHGAEHRNATDYKKVRMPNADTCKSCHAKQVEQFKAGKHSLAWVAMTAMPFTARQNISESPPCSPCSMRQVRRFSQPGIRSYVHPCSMYFGYTASFPER